MPQVANSVEEVLVERAGEVPAGTIDGEQPLVLRGLLANWPLVAQGRMGATAAIDYLSTFSRDQAIVAFRGNPAMGGRFFYNEDITGFNFDRITASLDALLAEFRSAGNHDENGYLYIGSTPVKQSFPGLLDENRVHIGDKQPLVSIWMGGKTRIAAHFDFPDNIAGVVAGRRRFLLFPPDQVANLYVGPVDFTPAGQAISLVDSESPDYERFPGYRDALAHAQVAELGPGDAIFIPSLWWHQVEGLDAFNVLINYWWRSVPVWKGNPMDALIHSLLAFNGMPAAQRSGWRAMFEYFLFDRNADAQSHPHIPPQSLGILGDIDEATAAQLRAMLRGRLGG